MTAPTDYRAIIRRLLAIWDTETNRTTVELRTDIDFQVTVLVRGLTAHAADCARGVLTLYDASQPVAAVPVIRSLMEDAVTAGWVLVVPDGWKAVVSEGSRTRAAVLRDAMAANASWADAASEARRQEYAEQVKALGAAPPSYKVFEQRLRALEGTDDMYMVYRYLSGLSHASSETVDLYTAPDPGSPLQVRYRRQASHSMAANLLVSAASSLLHALIAWDMTQVGRPHQAELDAIASELGVTNEWRAKASS
ncbi:DUF5677 domain-containing protein [Curtobacterium sp. NPDC098951]|uniref:DUF5677 domain-containing protein n=1 Tax=Curtobacterium sp. NPDC098951 TaxID=3363974 RepID=UPI003829C3FC